MYRYYLGLRYLLSRPINLLGVLGIALGVWALILVVSIFAGFIEVVREHIRDATSDVLVWDLGHDADFKQLRDAILRDPAVAACSPRVHHAGLLHPAAPVERPAVGAAHANLHAPRGDNRLVTLLGIDPAAEQDTTQFRTWLQRVAAGSELHLRDAATLTQSTDWILLSEHRAQLEGASRGQLLTLTTAQASDGGDGPGALALQEKSLRLAGTYSTRHSGFDEFSAFVHIDTLRHLIGQGHDYVTEICVRLHNPSQRQQVAARLGDALSSLPQYARRDFLVRRMPQVAPWEDLHQAFLESVEHQKSIMKIVLFVIMIVSAFQVYATCSMMVTEKRRDIGVLTAMGASRTGVLQVFLASGLGIGLCGTALGVLSGCLTARHLDDIRRGIKSLTGYDLFPAHVYNLDSVPHYLDWHWIGMVVTVALLTTLLVAGLPALRAARQSPLDCLRTE